MPPPGLLVNGVNGHTSSNGPVGNGRKLGVYNDVHFDPSLKPKNYQIKGTYDRFDSH